jgi:hypothetical protein
MFYPDWREALNRLVWRFGENEKTKFGVAKLFPCGIMEASVGW